LVEVPLQWKISMAGAEDVRARLSDLNNKFKENKISAGDYAKELRSLNSESRAFVNVSTLQKNIFLATHPAVNQLSRAMSVLGSTANTVLSITNALNLAQLALASTSTEQRILESERMQALRELMIAEQKYGKDSIEAAAAREKLNEINARIADETKRIADQQAQNAVSLGASVALIGAAAVNIITKVMPALTGLGAILTGGSLPYIIATIGAAAAPIAAVAAAIAAAAIGLTFFLAGLNIEPFKTWAESMSGIFGPVAKFIIKTFTIDFPNAIKVFLDVMNNIFLIVVPGMLATIADYFGQVMTRDLPAWLQAGARLLIEGFSHMWGTINDNMVAVLQIMFDTLVRWFGDIVAKIAETIRNIWNMFTSLSTRQFNNAVGTAQQGFSGLQGSQVINMLHAASGFEGMVNQPTLFLTGEAGPEYVSVVPNGGRGGGTGTVLVSQVIVQGSILAEREVARISDNSLKNALKQTGFGLR